MSLAVNDINDIHVTQKEVLKRADEQKVEEKSVFEEEIDSDTLNSNKTEETKTTEETEPEKKVGFFEGLKLFGKGFINKAKNMATGIFKHPVKSLLAIGATTALIAAAPLVGIASATAASLLAIGFAGFSLFKTGKDVAETIKDNSEGRYDEVREDIQNLGGDGLDLALSLPFLPKALKQVSRTIKYGRSTIGLNTELISNINKGGLASIPRELAKANTKISYEMIGNEMGLAVKPEIEFYNSPLKISDKMTTAGEFDPVSGNVKINEYFISGKGKLIGNLTGQNVETTLRHELEHFEQFSEIAREAGVEGLQDAIKQYYTSAFRNHGGTFDLVTPESLKERLDSANEVCDTMCKNLFQETYDRVRSGEISLEEDQQIVTAGSKDIYNRYIQPIFDVYAHNSKRNIDALNKMSELGFNYQNSKNIIFEDGSVCNSDFWENVIEANSPTAAQTGNSANYIEALISKTKEVAPETLARIAEENGIDLELGTLNKVFHPIKFQKFIMALYEDNLLEKEAFAAQRAFSSSTTKLRPDTAIVDIEATALSDDIFGNDEEDIPNIKELIEQIKDDEGIIGKTAEAIGLMFKFKKIL